ncbi:MAG: hypothetical protein JXA22_01830 [Candidatus Thermoplasmatota archaeon]|nr:hypothetical protein [Candidatus Thermoplasmatota archaeon]
MILPKGTVEFQMAGGENVIEDIIGRIKSGSLTGYVLVLGKIEKGDGELHDVTGQLVFKDGSAVLCEAVITNRSKKGEEGVFPILKAMMVPQNTIEFKSRIDVEPPLAFFKECAVDDSVVDIKGFMENMKAEEEDKRKMMEERERQEGRRAEISDTVKDWLSQGYVIPSFPAVMDRGFQEMDEWFSDLSLKIERIDGHMKWLSDIDEVEVEEQKEGLIEVMKRPEEMQALESAVTRFQDSLQLINEKRSEIQKWVNLWKEEGYNTIAIEETLEKDLTTAWNAMAEFMDNIQHLKDCREELDGIKETNHAKGFGSEIREIDLLLNDPDELDNIKRLIEELKNMIQYEMSEKEELMKRAGEMEGRGYDIKVLKMASESRLKPLQEKFNLVMNNIQRIEEIREELDGLDRRDISDDIDRFSGSTVDPMKLDEYEEELIAIMDRIKGLEKARNGIMKELNDLSGEGYTFEDLDGKADLSVEGLSGFRDDVVSRISELRDLGEKLSEMDSRWLEDDIREAQDALHDLSRTEWVKEKIGRIQEKIDIRERKREEVRGDLLSWSEEGFAVGRLQEVIEEDLPQFSSVWEDLGERIGGARGLLEKLSKMDVSFFREKAEEVKAELMDPFRLEEAERSLSDLKKAVDRDRELRKGLGNRVTVLKKEGWSMEGLDIMNAEPDRLEEAIADLEGRVRDLSGALGSIASWDELEKRNVPDRMKDMTDRMKELQNRDASMEMYSELEALVRSNKKRRDNILGTITEWKDAGYIIKSVAELQEGDIEALSASFEELRDRIMELERLQDEFDSLNRKHFPKEAEEIEFKLNDPDLLDEIKTDMEDLGSKIRADQEARDDYRNRIEDYMDQGFMGADRLSSFLEEDLSIVDLEFKNFAKEIDQFRKLKEKVGFIFRAKQEDGSEG